MLVIHIKSPIPTAFNYRPQRSWGKVIFSVACVKNSVHRGGVPGQVHPPGRYTPKAGTVSERAVRILLECILVYTPRQGGVQLGFLVYSLQCEQLHIPSLQITPVYPVAQVQLYPFRSSWHVAPLKQGSELHSSKSGRQNNLFSDACVQFQNASQNAFKGIVLSKNTSAVKFPTVMEVFSTWFTNCSGVSGDAVTHILIEIILTSSTLLAGHRFTFINICMAKWKLCG